MIPILWTLYDATPDKYYLLGEIEGLRVINMQNMSAGDEITYGGDTWKIFPNHQQTITDPDNIDNVALAVLKG